MIKKFLTAAWVLAIALSTTSSPLYALTYNRKLIHKHRGSAAVVNDKMISKTDVKNRVNMAILSSALDKNQQTYNYLYSQLLKIMIDEELQLQKTSFFKIGVSASELHRAIANIEQRNGMAPGKLAELFHANHIPFEAMERHVRASVAWREYIRERYEPLIQVNEVEIDLFLQELENSKKEDQVLLAELFLPFDSADSIQHARQNAETMVKKMRQGAHFTALAQEFSAAPSAAKGGDIGWIAPSRLEPSLRQALIDLPIGQLTNPIQTKNGYHILLLRDRRSAGENIGKDYVLSFVQVLLSLPKNAPDYDVEKAINRIRNLGDNAHSCEMMQTLTSTDQSIQIQKISRVPLRDMPVELRGILQNLSVGQASKPVLSDMGVMTFMVCEREEINPEEPGREEVRVLLTERKLASIAEREMRSLRRSAHITLGSKH